MRPHDVPGMLRGWAVRLTGETAAATARLGWRSRLLLALLRRDTPLRLVLQEHYRAVALMRFADWLEDRLDEEGTPTSRTMITWKEEP